MAQTFNFDNYIKAQKDLYLSRENTKILQNQMERFLSLKDLTAEEREWILSHRDYLSSLEVAFIEELPATLPTIKEKSTTSELVQSWQDELAKQQGFLGQLFHEAQCVSEGKFEGEAPLTDGESRRLMASIKDILEGIRLELKETRERKSDFINRALPSQEEARDTTDKEPKKGFFARLFGK